jgi:hypothetical protein
MKPCVLAVKSARCVRVAAIPSDLWTAVPQGFSGAYRKDGQD